MDDSAQPGANKGAALSAAMERLWVRFLPEINERAAILEQAAAAVSKQASTAESRQAAHEAAHKLAGVLGTFNLARGTDLARELELTFSRETPHDPEDGRRLAAKVAELRALIESRPAMR